MVALALFATGATLLELRDLDLAVYWRAAQQVFVAGVEPYTRPDDKGLPFTYPPTAFFLLHPLAGRTLDQASALLWALNLALAVLLLLLLPRDLARTGASAAALVAARRLRSWGPLYIASFGGLYLTLHFQQTNLLVLVCLWGFWRVLRQAGGRPQTRLDGLASLAGGAALALGSVAKPHYALLGLGALACFRGAGRAGPGTLQLLGAMLGGAALLWLSLVMASGDSWNAWLTEVLRTTSFTTLPPGHSSIAAPWNRSIAGEVARWLVPNKFTTTLAPSPAVAGLVTTLLVLTLGAATASAVLTSMRLRARRCRAGLATDPIAVDMELSLLSVWIFLAAPASWTHHLVMLLPAALVLLRGGVLHPRAGLLTRVAAGLVLAVLALTLDDLLPREVRTDSHAIMGLITVAVLGLWALLLEQLRRHNKHFRLRSATATDGYPSARSTQPNRLPPEAPYE
jgi:hypothetical protein